MTLLKNKVDSHYRNMKIKRIHVNTKLKKNYINVM